MIMVVLCAAYLYNNRIVKMATGCGLRGRTDGRAGTSKAGQTDGRADGQADDPNRAKIARNSTLARNYKSRLVKGSAVRK